MRAIVVDKPGGLDALELRQIAEPEIGPDDVLIETAYCGCNWADTQRRAGIYPHPVDYPDIIGREVSGTIAAVGSAVEGLAVESLSLFREREPSRGKRNPQREQSGSPVAGIASLQLMEAEDH